MVFSYKGIDKNGKNISGTIEAQNIDNAKFKLKQKKILIESIKVKKSFTFKKINFRYKIKPLELAIISRNLSIYLNSGITISVALKLLSQNYKNNKRLFAFFDSILSYLDEGKNFYTALTLQKIITLPEFYLQSIKVSEEGGMLKEVLSELSIYLKEQDRIKKQLISSLTYPSFIIIISIFMVGFMLSFIVPKITAIFAQTGQKLPKITEFVIDTGKDIYWIVAFDTRNWCIMKKADGDIPKALAKKVSKQDGTRKIVGYYATLKQAKEGLAHYVSLNKARTTNLKYMV